VSALPLGLVSYLNTSPFRYGLRALGHTNWINEVPSRLLPLLEAGQVEAAVLPSFDALCHPELRVLPGSCICSHGTAHSVRLFSRIALAHVTTIALDSSSRTSAALVRLIVRLHGGDPLFTTMAPDLASMLETADAALLIGDPCMRADASGLLVFDLGEEWLHFTGLPFVFALWAARPEADRASLSALVEEAKRLGLADLERIAAEESERLGLARGDCLSYLRDHMRYDLDERALGGLERFRQLAVEHGLIPDAGAA